MNQFFLMTAEFAETGEFFYQKLFTPRPRRLGGAIFTDRHARAGEMGESLNDAPIAALAVDHCTAGCARR
jgi:hypothetical protein